MAKNHGMTRLVTPADVGTKLARACATVELGRHIVKTGDNGLLSCTGPVNALPGTRQFIAGYHNC